MWFALFLLIVFWIEGPVWSVVVGLLAAVIVLPDGGWALGALFALACIASLAGWLERPQE